MKVLITKCAVSPYGVDFFNELGKYVELDVLYEYRVAYDRHETWSQKKAHNYNELFLKSFRFYKDKAISFDYAKYLKKKYDVIVVGEYATIGGMLIINYLNRKNIPFVQSIDGGIIRNDNRIKYNIKRRFISSANWWLSPSEASDNYLVHYGANKENIYRYPFTSIYEKDILPNILNEQEKMAIRNKLNIPEKQVVISVGSFIYRKGFDVLLNSFGYIDESIGLYLIGGTPTTEYLEIVKKHNLKNVHFIEYKTKEELSEYYKAADLFVLPTREDIWGLVINEAMSKGLPIITTNKCISGLELIEDGINGYIVPVDDHLYLAEKIKQVLSNKELQMNMSKSNLEKIGKYTIENMAKKHSEIFKEIVGSRK